MGNESDIERTRAIGLDEFMVIVYGLINGSPDVDGKGGAMKPISFAMLALGKAYEKNRTDYEKTLSEMKQFIEKRDSSHVTSA